MMQIIHDIAPGASLAFYTAFDSEQDFANGILALAAAGCKVIVDDVSYFDEPFFQNGVVAQAIQTVEAEGVTYVTAAGNDAGNGYQAAWTPISGTYDGMALTDAESFGGNLVQTITVNTEGTGYDVPLLLEWNQAYGAGHLRPRDTGLQQQRTAGRHGDQSHPAASRPIRGSNSISAKAGTYLRRHRKSVRTQSRPDQGNHRRRRPAGDDQRRERGTVFGHAMTPGAITRRRGQRCRYAGFRLQFPGERKLLVIGSRDRASVCQQRHRAVVAGRAQPGRCLRRG